MSEVAAPTSAIQSPWQVDRFVVVTALVGFALLGGLIWLETAPFMVALFAIGTVLGIALYHGAFGFTAGWRNLVVHKRGAGMRAQLLLFGVTSIVMVPLLYSGQPGLIGAVAPVGTSLVVGSFMFWFGHAAGWWLWLWHLVHCRRGQSADDHHPGVLHHRYGAGFYPLALVAGSARV
ncbi:MAG: YeeE/YedE family protein [Marinobacter sp.]|nr:YeeE/YedE family protein [Marinobacter sp.]